MSVTRSIYPKALVCPLDWGLGHATRMIPLIRKLVKYDFEVTLGTSGFSGEFLKEYFPDLKYIEIPSYRIRYSKRKGLILPLFLQIPKLIYNTISEHQTLKKLQKKEQFDLVISDHRYGLWNRAIYSVFVTHQLIVKFPAVIMPLSRIFNIIHHRIMMRYDEVWVPDSKTDLNLAGELSDKPTSLKSVSYVGILSRFRKPKQELNSVQRQDLLVLLSGPEPQRSVLEKKLLEQLKNMNMKVLFVRGTKEPVPFEEMQGIRFVSYLHSESLQNVFMESKTIICRAGYSSIMDLIKTGKKALLVPTPGQTEQEYLASYLRYKNYFYSVSQKDLSLKEDLEHMEAFHPPEFSEQQILEKKLKTIHQLVEDKISRNKRN